MKSSILKSLFTAIVFCLFIALSYANTYQIDIDYHHQSLQHTDSKSEIIVSFLDEKGKVIYKENIAGIYPISKELKSLKHTTSSTVAILNIEIKGGDAFFLDQVIIWKDGEKIQNYSGDNGKGWCLSTDGNDSFGAWKKSLLSECQAVKSFIVDTKINEHNSLGSQMITLDLPLRMPSDMEENWVYYDNETRREINAEGLGRCYDIRYIDPINWSNETLVSGQRASVIGLYRDNSKRPARHNNKDYVVPKGVVFTSEIIGDSEAESKFVSTSYEYETEVLEEYRADIGLPKGGSAKVSAAFKDVNRASGKQRSLYAFSKMYKQYYKLDLLFDDPAHQHYIDLRFWNGVKQLGHGMSAISFIEKFGTHYAASTYYGGNFLQRRTISQNEYAYYESNQSEFEADVEGTIKKVKFKVGTTQGLKNRSGETERVELSSAKIYTIGGDLNQNRPDLWDRSVLKNLAVVRVKLIRISDLLTIENFPDMPNIEAKKALLETAILAIEQEAISTQSQYEKHNFFTKKSATYKLTVTYLKCLAHGSKEGGDDSEYYGNIKMGYFNGNGTALKTKTVFKKEAKNAIDLAVKESYDLNKSLTYTVRAGDISEGYISVYGSMKEFDIGYSIQLSSISKHEEKTKIYFRNALSQTASKKVIFDSTYGDKVEVKFTLKKVGN